MLKLSFLGPPMVEWGGEPAGPFVSVKSLALLCYLAIRPGHHAREHLAGLLWGEMAEHRANANLRMALYNLQKLFPGYLSVTRTTAAFNPSQPYWLDVKAFESGVTAPIGEISGLQAALKLYRGEFLEGLSIEAAPDFEVWIVEQREHLRLSLARGLERLADYYARRGDWATGIDIYLRLLALDPLREDIQRCLMLTMARAGRYDSALAQYETCRRLLREELGVEPAPETTALYLRIQIARSRSRPNNLPLQMAPIIGREDDLGKITELLEESSCRLITLVGPGGIGKTQLSLHTAANKSREGAFLEGVFFVPLASVSTAELLPSGIADAIQLAFQGPADPRVQLLNHLRDKEVLLVLDNFEHLIDEGAGFLTDILAKAPDVKLLVTSRERLSLREEWLLEIQGLRFPKFSPDSAPRGMIIGEEAENYAAVRLFRDRARRVRSDFSLSEGESVAVARICQLVEGMPLGIELAASQVRTLSCQRIAEEIEGGLDYLATPLRDVPDRHRSMQAVFNYSWRRLSAEERNVFMKLSVFRGGFTRDAAQQVAAASPSILLALVNKSFLKRDPIGRYEVHELLRQYGEEKLLAVPQEWENVQNLYCSYFAEMLHRREDHFKGGKQVDFLREISREIDNIRATWHWAVDRRRVDLIGKCVEGLWGFYDLRCWLKEGKETFAIAVSALRGVVSELNEPNTDITFIFGKTLARLGWFYWRQGRFRQSKEIVQENLALLREPEPSIRRELGFSFFLLGVDGLYLGEYSQCRQDWSECLALCKDVGDQLVSGLSLMGLAIVSSSLGDYAEAEKRQKESLAVFRAISDRRGITSNLIWYSGTILLAKGEFDKAERYLLEGVVNSQELMDQFGRALALAYLGVLTYLRKDYSKAKQLQKESLEIFQEIGDQWGIAYALTGVGHTAHALGEYEVADRHFRKALKIAVDIETLPVAMDALVGFANLLHTGNQSEKERALALLGFVRQHSASSFETKGKAAHLIAEIEEKLPAQVVSDAKRRGQAGTLEAFMEELLGGNKLQ
jgi:predicted ATPase/DNA-binding SARP family transcriptional activator